jgi:hypothetical protein
MPLRLQNFDERVIGAIRQQYDVELAPGVPVQGVERRDEIRGTRMDMNSYQQLIDASHFHSIPVAAVL